MYLCHRKEQAQTHSLEVVAVSELGALEVALEAEKRPIKNPCHRKEQAQTHSPEVVAVAKLGALEVVVGQEKDPGVVEWA